MKRVIVRALVMEGLVLIYAGVGRENEFAVLMRADLVVCFASYGWIETSD